MERRVVDKSAVKRSAARSTKVSAKLEGREVPPEVVLTSKAQQYVVSRTRRAS